MVICPKCESEDVSRISTNPGCLAFLFFSFSLGFICLGIFFLPLIILGLLGLVVSFLLFLLFLCSFGKDAKWQWSCKKCKNTFTFNLDENKK